MQKLNRGRGRLLLSTCLSGVALAWAPGVLAQAQDKEPTWKPRAEVDARAADGSSQVSFELFAPVAQNDSNLLFVSGRIGTDERYDRNGSVTIGGRGKIGEDVAIGVNAGVDFYKTDITSREQTAVSFGLEGFTSVFDLHVNYRLPVNSPRTMGYLDPNASPVGVLSIENNRLIERKSGWRLEEVPLAGANAEIGARAPIAKDLSVRLSGAGFDYRDEHASKAYRGVRGGLQLDVEDPLGTGGRFSIGAELQNDNRWGTQARGTLRLSIPLGRGSADRSSGTTGLDRQMGDRLRRDYVTPSGTRYTDLTSTNFAVDARTGVAFGGVYFASGSGTAGAAGTSTATTTLGDAVTRAGANGIVVALGNAGNIASSGVTLATNQYLVGGASSVNVRHSDGSVSAFNFGGTNGIIAGTNAGGAAVTLGQGSVVRDVTVRGAGSGILANGVGGFALERVVIENTGAAGLTLTNTTGAVVVDGITIRGGAGAGVVINGGSNVTLRNSTIGGGAGAIDITDAGGNLTTSLSNLTLSATGGTVLDIDGSGAGTVTVAGLSGINIAGGNGETGGFAARFVTFDSSTAAGIQAVNAGAMQVGTTTARVGGAGVSLTEVDGALSFTNLNIANNGGTGLTVNNTKSGTFTLTSAAGTVDTTAGTALNLDPLLIDLTFSSVRSVGAAGAGIILDNVQGAGTGGNALTIGTLTITNSGQQGLYITGGSTGLVTIGGGAITNSGGASVQVGQSGVAGSGGTIGLNFGATITDAGAGPLVSLFNAGGTIRFTGAISGAGPITIADTLAGSSVTFTGTTTITGSTSPALSLNNTAGSVSFSGLLTIANPTGTGILIGNVPGGVTFGDVDITGLGAATGVDFTGTHGNVTFGTLDITGTGAAGSTGIDLTGATNAGAITITNPSVIQGVDIGANLTNAAITGSFRFGDGNAADGLESRITANTVIVVAGMNATQGTYDFGDVQLDGNTNNITGGSFTTYYVLAGATGAGTSADPGSLAGAAASGAQYIVLLNNPTGGQDVLDTAVLGGTLNLLTGQTLVSFRDTDFFAVTGATVPANLIVSNLGPTGITNTYTGSGAALLTSTTGFATVQLADNSRLDGLVIGNSSAGGFAVRGQGAANVVIQNSTLSGDGGGAIITSSGAAASLTLNNVDLSATGVAGGIALYLSGAGAGTLNVSGTDINASATGASSAVNISDVTVGTLELGAVTSGTSNGTGAQFDRIAGGTLSVGSITSGGTGLASGVTVLNSSATVNIGSVSASNSAGPGLLLMGNTGAVTVGSASIANSGGGVAVLNNAGAVTIGSISATANTGVQAGLSVSNSTGTMTFGPVTVAGGGGNGVSLSTVGNVTLGPVSVSNVAGNGVSITNANGPVTLGATSVSAAAGTGVSVSGVAGNVSIGALGVSNSGAGISASDVDGSLSFTGTTTIANSGGIVLGAGSTGTISFGDTDITGLGAGKTGVDARNAGGTVTFATLDITGTSTTGTRGIDLTGATFAGSLTVSDSSSITGVGTGVDLTNAAITGSFRYGDGSSTDADGAHSVINAITPIAIGGLNQAVGTYNFGDVSLVGDTTNLAINPVTIFFVEQGRTGAGTKVDPGSLAAAVASGANYIVLLNNPTGGQDVIDVSGLGTLSLGVNQHLIGFLNGDTQTVGGGTPVNLTLYGITPGVVSNPYAGSGAALLTNTGAGATVTLSNGSAIDGLRIGGTGLGVSGIGVTNVAISNSIISGGTGAILLRDGGVAASATLTNLTLSSTGGTVLNLLGTNGGTLTLSGSGISIAATGNARGLAMDTATIGSGNLAFTTVSTLTSAGSGVSLANNVGTGGISFTSINVGGTSSLSGVRVVGNSAAVNLGNVTVGGTTGAGSYGIEIGNNPGNVTLGTFNVSNTGAGGLLVFGMPGTFTAAGGTVTNSGTIGIGIGDVDGSVTFTGAVTVNNPGTAGIAFNTGSTGTISFADVDITGLGANRRGVDARLASGTISFNTLDIVGASATGTRGIDLTGATFAGSLIVNNSSSITGVGTGVDLTNAAITGTFRYGDGSSTDANGAGSTISATTPLIVAGLNALAGTYDFADVNLVGDTSTLSTSATVYWVLAGASGAGTKTDPGSLAGAAASGADVIILVNNPAGGNDTIDANDATYGTGGTFTLIDGQQLRGFLNGDTISLPGGAPANVVLYNIAQGIVTNPFAGSGAPTLTTSAGGGANTVVVGNNNVIDGLVIANGGTGAGVFGSGKSNVTISNSNISGANGAINFSDGGLAASIALSNLHLWTSNGAALTANRTGAGSTTITELSDIVIEGGHGENGGADFSSAIFDSITGDAGVSNVDASLQIGSATTRVTGTGVNLTGAVGSLNFSGLDIHNQGGDGFAAIGAGLNLTSTTGTIDTVNGTSLSLSDAQIDMVLASVVHAGTGSGIASVNSLSGMGLGGRALQVGTLTVTSGTSAIAISGNVFGLLSFGAGSSIAGTTGPAIALSSGTGTLDFSYAGSVTQGSNAALLDVTNHNGTVTFGASSNLSATNGTGLQFTNADGTYAFNGTTTLNGGDAGIDILAGSAGSFTFGNTAITSPTGAAISIANSTASLSYFGSITQANNAALVSILNHSGGTVSFQTGTLSATNGTGLQFTNADATYNFTGTTTLNGGDAGIDILGGSAGGFTFGAGTTITNPSGTAFNIASSTAGVTYLGTLNQSSAGALALGVLAHSGGTLNFSGATLNISGGDGISFDDADGTYSFGSATLTGGAQIGITNGSAGSFTFGTGTSVTNAAGAALFVSNSTSNLTYSGTIGQSLAALVAVDIGTHSGGTIDFTGATFNVTGGTGLSFFDADGTYKFDDLALSGGARIAILGGSAGTFTFGNVDLTGLAANTTGVNLTGATGNVTFATLDISGASTTGTRGIDMTGSTTASNVIVNGSSTITGVGIGVDLTNAAITGTFRYGDGANNDANGAASNIVAVTPLVIAGLNGGTGTYNFADVNLTGDTSTLSVSAYFVLEGATGTGSRNDPGSLAGAEASGAAYIVLLNNPAGGTDTLDATAGAGGSLDLLGGQILLGFRNVDSFIVAGGAPANVILHGVQAGLISNPFTGSGAPTLTASGANATVTLGGGNIIDGVVIANSGTGAGVLGNGAAAPITIRNSTISGGAAGALRIYDNAANVTLALSNLTLAANGGNILNLDGSGAGTFVVSQLSNLTVNHTTETGGFVFNDLTFDSDTVAAGLQALSAGALTLGTTASRITGTGLSLTNVTGTLNFTDLNIANNAGTGLIVANSKANNFTLGTTGGAIDTTNGTAINLDPLTIHMVLGSVRSTGGAYGILLDQVEGNFTVTGSVSVIGATNTSIAIRNNTAQTDPLDVHFQGGTILDSALTTGAGVSLTNNTGATVEFTGSLGIYTATGAGLTSSGGGTISVTGAFNGIYTGNAPALSLSGGTIGTGGLNFAQITAAPTAGTAISASGVTLTGALNIGGLDIDGGGTGVSLSNLSGTGGVNFTGTLDLDTTGVGFDLAGAIGTVNIANTGGAVLTIDGASTAIRFNGVTGGTVNVGNSGGIASIGATTSSTVAAIGLTASSGVTLNYGGTIGATTGSVLSVFSSSMLATLSGAITSTTSGTAFSFTNAGGIYTVSGSVSHNGGAGVAVDATSTGNVSFLNASKTFSTGANTAISMAGSGTLSLLGGGLGITTTSGTGFSATGGTLEILGAGNSINTATGQVLNLANVTAGAGGINFASLGSSGTVTATAINLSNLDGGAFSGGTVNIAGTSGATSDGIFVGGGSASTIGFGATTIGAAGSNAIELNGANGAVTFSSVTLSGAASDTVYITGATNAVTIGTGTITSGAGGYAVSTLGGTGNISIAATLNGANAVIVDNHETGTVTFSGDMSTTVTGISIANSNSGVINFTGQSIALPSIGLGNNAGATINFDPLGGGTGLDITSLGLTGFSAVSGGTINVTGTGNSITGGAFTALELNGVTVGLNGINFASITTSGAANGITFNNVGNAGGGTGISLGTVSLQGATSRGIDISGTFAPSLTITDLDIGLNSNSGVAFDLNGATINAAIAAGDFDVTNAGAAGTSIGVDLRGAIGGASVSLGNTAGASSSIAGVGTGVYLNASTNLLFTYGDGESATDTGSTISASTAIDASNAPALGTYNFRDVAFSGSPGTGFGINKIYFVDADGATGGGNGSGSDGSNPMSLAAAELVAGAQDMIILVNNGNAISAAGSNGNDSLVLASNVQVRGFGDGVGGGAGSGSAPITIAITVPSTIQLSGGSSFDIADPTGNGAATLTSAAGANVITLGAAGNHLSGFILDGGGAASRGIKDNGAGATNTLLDYLTVRNFGTMGIEITPSTSTTIDHVAFTGNPGGDVLLNAANSVLTNITSNGGGITLNNATGTTTLTNVALTGGAGLILTNAAGTINATNVDITNPLVAGLTISGGTAAFNFDSTSSVTKSSAGASLSIGGGHTGGTFAYAGTLNITGGTGLQFDNADGTYNFTGTTTLAGGNAGIDILNGSGGTFSFGTNTAITSPSGTAFNVADSTAAITYSGSITQANNAALVSILNHSGGTITFQTGTLNATNGTGLQFDNADATYNFNGTTTLNGGDAGVDILNGSGGSFGFGANTSITSPTGTAFNVSGSTAAITYSGSITQANNAALVSFLNHSGGTVTFQTGTLSATNGTGLQFDNADATYNFNGTTTLNGGDAGVDILNGSGGTFGFGTGTTITSPTGTAFNVSGSTAAVTYSGSITQANNAALVNVLNHSAGTLTFQTGTLSATNGTGLQFDNADGTYNFTGATTLNGGDAGIDIVNGSAGTFGFGSGTAITHATAGDAFVLTGSNANLTYSGSIDDSNGYAVRIDNHAAGTVTFDGTSTITSSGANALGLSVTNNAGGTINFNGQTTLSTQANNAVTLTGNAGSTVAFNAAGTGLGITTTSGTAFTFANGGTINVLGSNNTITTGSGTILDISNTAGVTSTLNLNFANASNTLGVNGILVTRTAGTLTGSVTINSGAIAATSRGIDVSGGTLSLDYAGTVATSGTLARSVEVTNITGGAITVSGNLTDNAQGINIANNSGGSINFYGQSITLNTVANVNAVTLASNTGTNITFSSTAGGNGVDITASGTGNGIDFTGGGTLTVYSTGNSIQTATGQILNLVNGNVGSLGLVFDSLTSTGSTNGSAINISNVDGTGTLSATTVSIAGTTGATADGIFYGGGSTMNVNLGAVTIANTGDEGIEINGAGNGTFTAGSVAINGTAGNGVEINGSDSSVTLSGGNIGATNDPAGIGLYVLNGTGAVNIAASITKTTSGNVVLIDNHETNAITLSGNISATGGFDSGISVQNVNSGSVTFSGTTKTLTTGANAAVDLDSNTGSAINFTNGGLAITTTSGAGFTATNGGTLTVQGAGNTVQTGTGQILNLVGVNLGAGNMTFGALSSTGSVAGTAINISNLDGNTLNGGNVTIAGTTGATADGIFYGGGSTTNVGFGTVSIANTGDEGIEINGAGNGNFTVTSVAINGTAGNGVEINGATNSVTLSGGNIGGTDDPAGFGVYVLNGTGVVSISSSITKTTNGNVVFVDNHETGNVTFSGAISATGSLSNGIVVQNVNSGTISFTGNKTLTTGANTAVNLLNNTGGTISFLNGNLAITTAAGTGFTATGGGTVTVEGTGNTISSGSGTALNVVNTTIGTNGLRFQSISSNGAASGIILNNTGSSGGINVTGTGAAGSGGTIQNSAGDGISLTSTENVRLAYMNVTNNLGDGIGGSNVNGFLIDNMLISGNGNDAGTDESGINISELTGTASGGARPTGIFNSTIQNNNEFEVQITNSTGTLTNFQVVNSTFASNGVGINGNGTSPHGNIFNFLGTGTSAMGISVSGSNFTGNWNATTPPATIVGSGLFADSSGTSMTVQVSSSFFTNTNNGINVSTGPGSTTLTYNIDGNTFTGTRATAINDFQNGNAPFTRTVNGRITNNIIGNNAVTNSGSNVGNGISIGNEGGVNANYFISGNTIQQIQTSQGIVVNVGLVGQATGNLTTNVTITNNTIRNINGSRGLVINNNQNTGGFPTVNVSISGNSFSGIAGQAGNGQYLRLSASGGGTINVTQGQATASAIASELDDANGFNDTTKISIGTGTFNYGQPAPTLPPASVPLP
ncbi:hypothetical protein ACCC88_04125 [Sphingomonas sp. Sphisp140]|uniref:hypothetical protein n=1 Tax=unclassified Sphingomonas TaxID=196159 RepID=UPI0039AEC824